MEYQVCGLWDLIKGGGKENKGNRQEVSINADNLKTQLNDIRTQEDFKAWLQDLPQDKNGYVTIQDGSDTKKIDIKNVIKTLNLLQE